MYWSHLIFALFAVLVFKALSAAKPGYLDFDNLPETNFSCENKVIGGYYADVETGCQMFHVCTIGQKGEITDIKFLCLNGTVFDQETRVCERIDEVDCSKSEHFFGLNLELYGNNGHQGIQPENELECEECSTDDEYEDLRETTTFGSTSTASSTTIAPSTSTTIRSTTSDSKLVHFPSSTRPETIAALLALHNAFTLSLQQQQKVNAPPPRVINNAFGSTNKPTRKPSYYDTTQSGNININLKTHYITSSSVTPTEAEKNTFYQLTTPPTKSNYHHFQNSEASFDHDYDSEKPYDFQYFHSRRIEGPTLKASVSVVTSTSTSTSIRTSKTNITDFPSTGYDYQDSDIGPFFRDIPKIRTKRSNDEIRHPNHRYPNEKRFSNHNYQDKSEPEKLSKEEFLGNLLNSLDMEDHDRKKMADFFRKENKDMNDNNPLNIMKKYNGKLGELIMEDINKTINSQEKFPPTKSFELELWKDHFNEMNKELEVDFKLNEREKRDLRMKVDNEIILVNNNQGRRKRRIKRQVRRGGGNIDTEKFAADPAKGRRIRTTTSAATISVATKATGNARKKSDVKPVSEEIDEGDFTTAPYRRLTSKRSRDIVRTTKNYARTSQIHFNYETTTSITPTRITNEKNINKAQTRNREILKPINVNITRDITKVKEVPVYEDLENPVSSVRIESRETTAQSQVPNTRRPTSTNPSRRRGRTQFKAAGQPSSTTTTTTTTAPVLDPSLIEDINFSCKGKIKGGYYADLVSDCRGFFICSQGIPNGPLLKSHFWCGTATKFNQRSRTCQTDYLVDCSYSERYYHLNNDFLPPEKVNDGFESMKVSR